MTRPRLTLPFGGGLDRKTGSAVVDRTAFANLQNVHLYAGRMELRKGLEQALQLPWGEDLIAIEPIRSQGVTACVVWDSVSRQVRLYLVDGTLTVSTLIGTLWTIPGAVTGRPEVLCAELYNKLVIAHNEPVMAARQTTKVYDATAGTLANLAVDLDRSGGAENVKFRGVVRHLNYLCGWGYGTGADEDRPEVFRISIPGIPGAIATWFVPEHYFLVGMQGDPILAAGKAGNVLEICKASEAHGLVGYSRDTFGIVPLDTNFGQLTGRLAVTVGHERFRWSLQGPRVSTGGESIDLEMPLDLAGPDPIAAVESENAFAFYDPSESEVLFVFDDFAYVLHLKDGQRRWSYRPFAYDLGCAGLIYTGTTALLTLADATPLAVYVDPPFSGMDVDDYQPGFNVTWTLTGALLGGEMAEVWVRSLYAGATVDPFGLGYDLAAGEWKLRATVAASTLAAAVKAMHFHTNHEIAVRLTLGGVPGVGYFGTPDTWPASSRITQLANGAIDTFELPIPGFSRTSALALTRAVTYLGPGIHPNGGSFPLQPQLTTDLEASDDAGAGWDDVSGGNPVNHTTAAHAHADRHKDWRYRLRVIGPNGQSAFATTPDKWLGPEAPPAPTMMADTEDVPGFHNEFVSIPSYAAGETVADLRVTHEPAGTEEIETITSPLLNVFVLTPDGLLTPPQDAECSARHTRTAFGETDLSEWVTGNTINEI